MIYRHKNEVVFLDNIFSNKIEKKSRRGFKNWTYFFMSIFEKPKKVLKKGVFFTICEHNALILKKK